MSRDAGNYLILVEKILGKTKEVCGGSQGELQHLRPRQLRALLRMGFGKAGWGDLGHEVLLGLGGAGPAGAELWWHQGCVSHKDQPVPVVWAALQIPSDGV